MTAGTQAYTATSVNTDVTITEAALAMNRYPDPASTALVAERAEVIELPLDAAHLSSDRLRGRVARARWVLLDTNGEDPATGRPYWREADSPRVIGVLEREGFRVTYAAQGVYLLVAGQG